MTNSGVLALHVDESGIHARRAGRSEFVAATTPRSPDGTAPSIPGLLEYAAARVGAPPDTDTAIVVHPTSWSARRRDELHTAVRQLAHNVDIRTVAEAALAAFDDRTGPVSDGERCVVVEMPGSDTTATAVIREPDGSARQGKIARDIELDVASVDSGEGIAALETLVHSVAGRAGVEVLIVTGVPGEPSGVTGALRLGERLGDAVRVVPVAAVEMLEALTAGAGTPAHAVPSWVEEDSATARWLDEVRASSPLPAQRRLEDYRRILGGAAAVLVVTVIVVLGIVVRSDDDSDPGVPLESVVAVDATPTASADRPTAPPPSAGVVIGPVRLELPAGWTIREPGPEPGTVPSDRAELLPDSGTDRRIVVVYSRLDDGTELQDVGVILAERAAHRVGVIRDLDTDTRFADRRVITYIEVPEEYSEVRWAVMVDHGVQVSIGCQFLVGEWAGIRRECEQAVSTLEVEEIR